MGVVIPFEASPRRQLQQHLEGVGLDPSALRQDFHPGELVDSIRQGIRNWPDTHIAGNELTFGTNLNQQYSIHIAADSSGSQELITSRSVMHFDRMYDDDSEVDEIVLTPSAIRRTTEPIVSICRAGELIDSAVDAGHNQQVVRIGINAAATLGIAASIFRDRADLDCVRDSANLEALAEACQLELRASNRENILEQISLRFAGAVMLRYCVGEIVTVFRPDERRDMQMSYYAMLKSIAHSRKINRTQPVSTRRTASYAIEEAYSLSQMSHIIPMWFREV